MPDIVYQSIRDAPVHQGDAPVHQSAKRERHSRTPDSVLKDKGLSLEAMAIFAAYARHAFKGGLVYIGQRRLATLLGVDQSTISRHTKELIDRGHMKPTEEKRRGYRSGYKLLSNIFQPREHAGKQKQRRRITVRDNARALVDTANARDQILA